MDPTLSLIATFIVLALYGAVKYAQQTFGDNPQQWDTTKFFTIIGAGAIVVVVTWYSTGVTGLPTNEYIDMVLQYIAPLLTTLGGAVTVLLGGKYVKEVVTNKVLIAPVSVSQALPHLGFTVIPAFLEGKSQFLAVFQIKCSTICIGWRIDWLDGSPVQEGGFVTEEGYNVANLYHTYTYQFDGKYTGHTFYPKITIISKDGIVNTFNTEVTGRCLSIGVNA